MVAADERGLPSIDQSTRSSAGQIRLPVSQLWDRDGYTIGDPLSTIDVVIEKVEGWRQMRISCRGSLKSQGCEATGASLARRS